MPPTWLTIVAWISIAVQLPAVDEARPGCAGCDGRDREPEAFDLSDEVAGYRGSV